jgi:hypothetical protein
MKIALDFDETYTEDEDLWKQFIDAARENDHEVYIVTRRADDGDNMDIECSFAVVFQKVPVIYCGFKPKREICERHGLLIDVWIDDWPLAIDGAV